MHHGFFLTFCFTERTITKLFYLITAVMIGLTLLQHIMLCSPPTKLHASWFSLEFVVLCFTERTIKKAILFITSSQTLCLSSQS